MRKLVVRNLAEIQDSDFPPHVQARMKARAELARERLAQFKAWRAKLEAAKDQSGSIAEKPE